MVYSKGDEVKVVATIGANAQYNGMHGTVVSVGVVSQSVINAAGAFYPQNVVDAAETVNFYYVCVDMCHIVIRGEELKLIKRAPAAGGAAGAP